MYQVIETISFNSGTDSHWLFSGARTKFLFGYIYSTTSGCIDSIFTSITLSYKPTRNQDNITHNTYNYYIISKRNLPGMRHNPQICVSDELTYSVLISSWHSKYALSLGNWYKQQAIYFSYVTLWMPKKCI